MNKRKGIWFIKKYKIFALPLYILPGKDEYEDG